MYNVYSVTCAHFGLKGSSVANCYKSNELSVSLPNESGQQRAFHYDGRDSNGELFFYHHHKMCVLYYDYTEWDFIYISRV